MRKYFVPINLILFIGLFLRLLNYYFTGKNNPIFDLPIVDAKEYADDASYYNDVSWLGMAGSYFHPPGYSYFIGIIYLFFGKSLTAIRLVQTGLDVVNIYLVFLVAQKTFDRRAGLLSALLYAIYVRTIQYSIEILPPVFVIFLLLMSIHCLISPTKGTESPKESFRTVFHRTNPPTKYGVRQSRTSPGEEGGRETNRIKYISLSAFFLGLLIITLPNFLLILPAFMLWIFFTLSRQLTGKVRMGLVFLFLIISLFPTFLTALRNRVVADEGLLISRNGGINFFIGNNPDIKKTAGATPGIEWEKLLMIPYQTERTVNFQEQDDFFSQKAVDYVKNNFGDWLQLMCKKTLWYFNAYEFPRNFDVYYFSQYSFVTKYPILNFSIILPLALSFIVCSFWFLVHGWISKRLTYNSPARIPGVKRITDFNCQLLLGIFFIYSFSIVLIFVAARYRLPVIPLMLIFASAFLLRMYDMFRRKKILPLIIYCSLAGIVGFITHQKFFFEQYPYHVSPVFTNMLLANTLLNAGKAEEGKKYLDNAIALPMDEATDDAYFELGHYYRGIKEKEKAKECFYRAVKSDSLHFKAWNSLGFDYKMEGNFAEAIKCLQKGISAAPCFPELYLNLADCYLIRKKTDSAVVALKSYCKNCPSPHPHISESLGRIYMDAYNDFENAAKYYEESIRYPQGIATSPETYNRLGACRFKLGSTKEAKDAWTKGLKIDPENKAIKTNLDFAEKQIQNWNSL